MLYTCVFTRVIYVCSHKYAYIDVLHTCVIYMFYIHVLIYMYYIHVLYKCLYIRVLMHVLYTYVINMCLHTL